MKSIEITTKVGCKNNFIYCPQERFLSQYFKENKNRKIMMSLDDFQLILNHLPKSCMIIFSGMGEPFENDHAADMILLAQKSQRKIRVNTTLRGLDVNLIEKIKNVDFVCFCVHTPDNDLLQRQTVDDEHLEKIKAVSFLANVRFMVIGTPHPIIKSLLSDKLKILPRIIACGNNLNKNVLPNNIRLQDFSKKAESLCVTCNRVFKNGFLNKGLELDSPVVLPDGSVVLCCMDFAMKHVIGNLYQSSYDYILKNNDMKRIKDSMRSLNNDYLLCRECEWSVNWDGVRNKIDQ